jgi:hypothetical protein
MIGRKLRAGVLPRLMGRKRWRVEGDLGVGMVGHRAYIGGRWEEYGQLEFDFLVSRGLKPEHVLLDIACGSLRAGVKFIPYLDAGNYLGIEKEDSLIKQGLAKELAPEVAAEKRPELVVSGDFEFERFSKQSDYSLAWSLFTHLTRPDLEKCLANLRAQVPETHQFYATFLPGEEQENEAKSHAHAAFYYPREEMEAMGARNGWGCDYIGDISREREMKMRMMLFTPAPG